MFQTTSLLEVYLTPFAVIFGFVAALLRSIPHPRNAETWLWGREGFLLHVHLRHVAGRSVRRRRPHHGGQLLAPRRDGERPEHADLRLLLDKKAMLGRVKAGRQTTMYDDSCPYLEQYTVQL